MKANVIGGADAPTVMFLSDNPFFIPMVLVVIAGLFFAVRYWNRKKKG